jgi:hypothetical protein
VDTTLPATGHGSLGAMVRIEALRFARHPLFLVGCLAATVITVLVTRTDDPYTSDILSWPIIPAFFIGLPSLVVAANLTRSTEAAAEAMGTAPGTESRRTLAVAGAALVPLAAGVLWLVGVFVILAIKGPHPHELWFGTMNDLHVWSILIALAPVACLGAALLGVLVGRWLRFRGAPAVFVVALVAVDILAQVGTMGEDIVENHAGDGLGVRLRLWTPWALWHSGTVEDGRSSVAGGDPFWYLLYLVALCALAVGGAVWHDRTARTAAMRVKLYGVIAVAVGLLALAVFAGPEAGTVSEPLPFKVSG